MKSADRFSAALYCGFFLGLGLLGNHWFLQRQFSGGAENESTFFRITLYVSQILFVVGTIAAIYFWAKFSEGRVKHMTQAFGWTAIFSGVTVTLASVAVMGFGSVSSSSDSLADKRLSSYGKQPADGEGKSQPGDSKAGAANPNGRPSWMGVANLDATDPRADFQKRVVDTFTSEQLVLWRMADLSRLSKNAENLSLPSGNDLELFSDAAQMIDLKPVAGASDQSSLDESTAIATRPRNWDVDSKPKPVAEGAMWQDYFSQVRYFEYAKFYFVKAHFIEDHFTWSADIGFQGLARTVDGEWQAVNAKLETKWERDESLTDLGPREDSSREFIGWKIVSWKTVQFETEAADKLLFREVTDLAVPDPGDRHRLQNSGHQKLNLEMAIGAKTNQQYPYHHFAAFSRHPGLSIVDVNQDGYDDIYIMQRFGKNQLLLNRGDGTFREAAAEFGLAIQDHCSCAVFADFDNDGDPDVWIGRTILPSLYLVNDNGTFIDRSNQVDCTLPADASSLTAVDYDQDGLMDVLLSTYKDKGRYAVDEEMKADMKDELAGMNSGNQFLDKFGPSNKLFRNLGGGRFERVKNCPLAIYRNTQQATWSDFDQDGDMDLYYANDYAPDNFFRNDGSGKFVDITNDAGFSTLSLSMGVTWGDCDGDGRLDMYVSNMYSKAGNRVLGGLGDQVDARYMQTAEGNGLYLNKESGFEKVQGGVEKKAGWSWGGQFVDVDNDGDEDIYVVAGYYTACSQFAVPGDG